MTAPSATDLRRYRDQVRIADRVHFLGERGDVPRLLPHFDVLWSTSGYEGQSNVILEAMAAGVPVVATDIPGTRELVLSGTTGYLVAVGDRAGFAKHTARLLDDPALAARLSAAARQRAQSEFSVERMVAAATRRCIESCWPSGLDRPDYRVSRTGLFFGRTSPPLSAGNVGLLCR